MKIIICWFRRDLRFNDNAALYHALRTGKPVLPLFIFDKTILDKLEDKDDKRVTFIWEALHQMQHKLVSEHESTLSIHYGFPAEVWKSLINEFDIEAVYTNHDYEQAAQKRDAEVRNLLKDKGIPFHTYKDQCILEKDEVLKPDGKPYTVFTPYSKRWLSTLTPFHLRPYPTEKYFSSFWKREPFEIPRLEEMGFERSEQAYPAKGVSDELILNYGDTRNFPAVPGTSRLSVHLRFGTISIRALAAQAEGKGKPFLNELIWRDFYMMILWHFPHVETKAFRPKYDRIPWRNNEREFEAWCEGRTGYPIVDAGMRELNETGYMHNRVRMITASFLTKHLLIDWRWGEAYFAKKLLDFDLSANNGGWQWASGSGCDAAPYFRIFNPTTQIKKFDKDLEYIRKYAPDFQSLTYPQPIVDHKAARERALQTYKTALENIDG